MLDANHPPLTIPSAPLLPPEGVERYVAVDGAQIWYSQWAAQACRDPVLLLHGGLMNSNYFGHLIRALLINGYGVITLDSRSQGRSPYSDGPITYDVMEQDVVALLDHLRLQRVSLVGWSDGGIIGLQLAMNHPDRLSRLFTFGANTDPSGNIEDTDSLPTMVAHAALEKEEYVTVSATPASWDQVRAAIALMWRTLPKITSDALRTIRVPTTVCLGQHDECIKPEHTRYIAAQIPKSTLVILPNVSHFAMIQDPAAFNQAVLEFLQR